MIEFSKEAMAQAQRIIKRYPEGKQKSALLPILHLAQAEFDGWLSPETMDYVASVLNIKPIEVYEVASFYSMYNLKPVGKCLLEVCRTGPCLLRGADDVISYLENKLNIEVGGANFYENLTEEKLDILIEKLGVKGERSSYLKSFSVSI
jgi:NADH-quinone oxidoreductase subunit E